MSISKNLQKKNFLIYTKVLQKIHTTHLKQHFQHDKKNIDNFEIILFKKKRNIYFNLLLITATGIFLKQNINFAN